MALQRVPNLLLANPTATMANVSNATLDAAGESAAAIGYVALQNGNAATKTISSSGGAIYWRTGAVTFGNAGTNLRIGIQDVSATTGLEDAVFDVQADLVGGTDTITANAYMKTAMESGSKTLTHGDLIAIVFEMTARVADSVVIARVQPSASISAGAGAIPYGTVDAGTLAKNANIPIAMIEFDDGTVGWIMGTGIPTLGNARVTYGNASATDEYCAVFTPTFTCEIDAIGLDAADIDAGDTFQIKLYSNPLVTPATILTLTPDEDQTFIPGAAQAASFFFCTPTTLTAGTVYGVSLLPTSANTVAFGYVDFGSGNQKMKRMSVFGESLILAGRADSTGAFTEVQTYQIPGLFLRVSKLDDGVSAAGFAGFWVS